MPFTPASAKKRTGQELFNKAQAVVLAIVTNTRIAEENYVGKDSTAQATTELPALVTAEFEALEYFKKPKRKIRAVQEMVYGPGNCTIGLMSGSWYIFFIQDNLNVNRCTGSQHVTSYKPTLDKIKKHLRKLAKNQNTKTEDDD